MNNDLISRSALAARIKQIHKDVCDGFQHVKFIEDCIQDAPAVNAEPVRHGTWMPPAIGPYGCLCSRCNLQADNDFDYCPNCGAKMDKEDAENG